MRCLSPFRLEQNDWDVNQHSTQTGLAVNSVSILCEITLWYALKADGALRQLRLLYTALSVPTLIAMTERPIELMGELLQALVPLLPQRCYAHLHPALLDVLSADDVIESCGIHLKMGWRDSSHFDAVDTSAVTSLCASLCRALLADGIEHIGLNVKADNANAIALYKKLRFVVVAEFGAYMLEWRR